MARFRAYLQLVRLPAVFTALADIVLGLSLKGAPPWPLLLVACLLGTSGALYLAGMALNDFFDRAVDARERPGRPIPSGRVSPRAAALLGAALLALGLALAYSLTAATAKVALVLAALILAYDGYLKKTPLGPVAMGGCRFLNVLLGSSAAPDGWASPIILAAASLGVYVAGITWFSRNEAAASPRSDLLAACAVVHAGIAGMARVIFFAPGWGVRLLALGCLAAATAYIDARLLAAVFDCSAKKVQRAVKHMLLAIIFFDATLVYSATGSIAAAGATAALAIPAAFLGRFIFIT